VSLPRAPPPPPPPPLVETAEQTQGGGVSDSDEAGGWTEEEEVLGTDEEIPDDAAMTPPPHAGGKRAHAQQQQALPQAAGVPAAQKRARLPHGHYADTQEGGRSDETDGAERTARPAELKKTMKLKGGKGQASSRLLGVSWDKDKNKWRAQRRTPNKKNVHLEFYANEKDAARAYTEFVQHGTRDVVVIRQKSSRFRGVFWHTSRGKWTAYLA
jgi:hypothetical protein